MGIYGIESTLASILGVTVTILQEPLKAGFIYCSDCGATTPEDATGYCKHCKADHLNK